MGNIVPDARVRCDKCDSPATLTYLVSADNEEDMNKAFPDGYNVMYDINHKPARQDPDRPEARIYRCASHPFKSSDPALKVVIPRQ